MNIIKRIYITAFGNLDSAITKIQNHDALLSVSLKEFEGKIENARIALKALQRSLNKTENDIHAAKADVAVWQERAVERGKRGTDQEKEKAIECLRRSNMSKKRVAVLEKQYETTKASYESLKKKIDDLKNTYTTLSLKHKELKAKEAYQGAHEDMGITLEHPSSGAHEVQKLISQWEDILSIKTDYTTSPAKDEDAFEADFLNEEEKEDLNNQLSDLIK
jgi:phage shock protein A